MNLDYSQPPFTVPISATSSRESVRDLIRDAPLAGKKPA